MKQLKEIIKFAIFMCIFCGCLFTGYVGGKQARRFEPKQPEKIRSVGETQVQLRNAGYYQGRIDYIWGPNTEAGYCQYKADESMLMGKE